MSWVTKAFTWGGTRASDLSGPGTTGEPKPSDPSLEFLPDRITGTTLPTPKRLRGDKTGDPFLPTHLLQAIQLSSTTGLEGDNMR